MQRNGNDNKSFEDNLDKLGRAYSRLGQDEPPELLDQAILNSAHRAVARSPRWLQFGWLHGLTTAAVFVLAFSIILNQREPVPVEESELMHNEPALLYREKAAEKQSVDQLSERRRAESDTKKDARNDSLQAVPATTLPQQDISGASVQGDRAEQPSALAGRSLRAQDERQGERVPADDGDTVAGTLPEASLAKEVGPMADSARFEVSELKASVTPDAVAEQLLAGIIKLKQAGDEAWKKELELFMANYPAYPLPDELKN